MPMSYTTTELPRLIEFLSELEAEFRAEGAHQAADRTRSKIETLHCELHTASFGDCCGEQL